MIDSRQNTTAERSGFGLIFAGLMVAFVGAVAVMLMVIGLSYLYVGGYLTALMFLIGFVLCGSIFLGTYGPYLKRLEQRAPLAREPSKLPPVVEDDSGQTAPPDQDTPSAEPMPTNVIVALATSAYGLLIVLVGLIWTRGGDLMLNLLAGAALLISALVVWNPGKPKGPKDTAIE